MEKIKELLIRFKRLITFCFVGVINTLADFLVYTLLGSLTQLPLYVCQACGYVVGIIVSFVLNSSVTFKKGSTTSLGTQIVRFVLVNGVSLLVSMLLIYLLVDLGGVNKYIGKIIVTPIVMAINYFGYKILVFGVKDK